MADNNAKIEILNEDLNKLAKSIKDLRQQLKLYKDALVDMGEENENYSATVKQAADVQHRLKEQMEEISASALDFGQILGNVNNTLAGVTGTILTVKGAMTLLGVESENVEKAIQKMQALMAMTQGLNAIDNGIKSFKRLTLAIKTATAASKTLSIVMQPKVLLAVGAAIGAVVAVVEKLKAKNEELKISSQAAVKAMIENNKRLFNSYKDVNKEIESLNGNNINQVKAAYDLARQQFEKTAREISHTSKESVDWIYSYTKSYFDAVQKAANATSEEEAKAAQISANAIKQTLDRRLGNNERLIESYQYMYDLMKQVEILESSLKKNASGKETTNLEQETTETISELKLLEREYLKNADDYMSMLEQNTINRQEYDQLMQDLDNQYVSDQIYIFKTIVDNEQLSFDERLNAYKQYISLKKSELAKSGQEEIEIENENLIKSLEELRARFAPEEPEVGTQEKYDQDLEILKNALDAELVTREEYNDLFKKLEDEKAMYAAEKNKQIAANSLALGSAVLSSMTSILDQLSADADTSTREGFERNKKVQIAAATINMLAGITAAISGLFTTKSGPWDIALAAVQAATIAASAGVEISKIKKQQYDSGTSSVGTSSINRTAMTQLNAPVQYTNDVNSASIEKSISSQKIYVSVEEINQVDKKLKTTVNETRF